MQMKKWIAAGLLLVVALTGGAYLYFHGKTYEVRLTEAELRDKLSARFPLTKSYLLLLQVTLQQPRIALHDGSERIELGVDTAINVHVDKQQLPLGGSIDVETGIRYEPGTGQFFLSDPAITRLDVQGIPAKYTATVRELVRSELGRQFARYPVYTLRLDNVKTATALLVLRRVQIDHGVLVLTLGI